MDQIRNLEAQVEKGKKLLEPKDQEISILKAEIKKLKQSSSDIQSLREKLIKSESQN